MSTLRVIQSLCGKINYKIDLRLISMISDESLLEWPFIYPPPVSSENSYGNIVFCDHHRDIDRPFRCNTNNRNENAHAACLCSAGRHRVVAWLGRFANNRNNRIAWDDPCHGISCALHRCYRLSMALSNILSVYFCGQKLNWAKW